MYAAMTRDSTSASLQMTTPAPDRVRGRDRAAQYGCVQHSHAGEITDVFTCRAENVGLQPA
jgi:hypothetical protein